MSLMIFYLFFLLVEGRAFFQFSDSISKNFKNKTKTAEEVKIGTEYFYRIGLPLKFKTASFHIAAGQKVTEK
jgi:hypothetical protein